MRTLTQSEMNRVEGGDLSPASACGVAIGLSFFFGPVAAVAAVGFCFLANPTPAY